MLRSNFRLSALLTSDHTGKDGASSSNIRMLTIAAAFLIVTIGLILLQPGLDPAPDQNAIAETQVPQPATPDIASDTPVTRSDASLLSLETPSAAQAVSRQLRQPIRLTDSDASHADLRSLTERVLNGFGYTVAPGDRLHGLLVQALTEGQSNAYIDALLNTAAARGEFTPPLQLQLSSGRMDTNALLMALVQRVQG